MSDFDDEAKASGAAADDVWDDEPAPAKRPRKAAPPADDWDDDWDDEDDRRGGKRDLTLVYAVAAAAIVIVLAIVLTQDKDDDGGGTAAPAGGGATTEQTVRELQWQGPVGEAVDKVENRIDTETGVFIWSDFQGWHVRSTLDQEITVVVRADQILEKDAEGEVTGDPKTEITGTIPVGDGSTGLDVDLGFSSQASFEVTAGGAPIPADQIKLGGNGQADQNPVSFIKA